MLLAPRGQPAAGPGLRGSAPGSDMTQAAALAALRRNPIGPADAERQDLGDGANGTGDSDPDDNIFSIAAGFELATTDPARRCAASR